MKCSHCGSTKRLIKYSKGSKNRTKQYYYCNKCNTERIRKYRETEQGKEAIKRAVHKYQKKNVKRKRAWNKAKRIKLKSCLICHKSPTHRHHPDINKPLEIIFLCPFHHKLVHKL